MAWTHTSLRSRRTTDDDLIEHLRASATQSVYGRRRLLLDADFDLSEADLACWIDATKEVGRHLHQVFRGYVVSEFSPHSFTVSKVSQPRIPDITLTA